MAALCQLWTSFCKCTISTYLTCESCYAGQLWTSLCQMKDVMLEPNPKTVYDGPIQKMKGLDKC